MCNLLVVPFGVPLVGLHCFVLTLGCLCVLHITILVYYWCTLLLLGLLPCFCLLWLFEIVWL